MANKHVDKYSYTALELPRSVRLLHVHPSISFQSAIEISLEEQSLDNAPEFAALSYTWATEDGDASLSQRLHCNGKVINSTVNCEAALRRLRQDEKTRVLWVDAVCIDQSNDEEKSLQITLMHHIYSQASWVGCWIGETSSILDEETSTPLSVLGMTFLHEFAVEIADRTNSGQDVGEGPLYREVVQARRAYREFGSKAFTPRVQGFWDILHRRWWSRLWAIQELALAKSAHLLCGNRSEPFENLELVINALVRREKPIEEFEFKTTFVTATFHHFYARDSVKRRRLGLPGAEPLAPGIRVLNTLNATRNTRATDARDKIFGVAGLFGDPESDPENVLPLPDYTKSAAELYSDVARTLIKTTRNLHVMSSCYGFLESTIPNLPSWAAAWNDSPLAYFDAEKFNSASGSEVIYEESENSELLTIKGRKVDVVRSTCEIPTDLEYSNEAYVQIWRQWHELAFSLHNHPTGEAMSDIFMDTLCWGSNLKYDRLSPGEYQETFDAWMTILQSKDGKQDIFEDQMAFTFSHRASFVTIGRVLGLTSESCLALLPVSAAQGDDIVIFSGGKLPFVVRTQGDKKKLVGPCYVRGMMDGEKFAEALSSDDLEWFTLS